MKKKLALIGILSGIFCFQGGISFAQDNPDDDYYIYSQFEVNSENCGGSYGIEGYEGNDGVDRVILLKNCWSASTGSSNSTAFILKVTIPEGEDPNTHPLNEDATGSIAPRSLVLERTFSLNGSYGHGNEFYVGEDGFYLGAAWEAQGIEHYDWDGAYLGNVVNVSAPGWPQTLAFDGKDTWYVGDGGCLGRCERTVYKYKMGVSSDWEPAFTYISGTNSTMSHHDGMEFVGDKLYLADYVGDYVLQFNPDNTNSTGPTEPTKIFYHAPLNHELEGMGFGALNHFWVGSHGNTITEFGGGSLQKEIVLPIPLDIKPGSCPNSFNPKGRGVLPVALAGTDSVDVSKINPESIQVTINGEKTVQPLRWNLEDVATPYDGEEGGCHEWYGDGITDMTFKFDSQELVNELGLENLAGESVKLKVTGNMTKEGENQQIEGSDYLRVLESSSRGAGKDNGHGKSL